MSPHPAVRWSYWAAVCAGLMVGLAGRPEGYWVAAAVSSLQLLHYLWLRGSFSAFPVQVRLAYLAMMLLDLLWPPMAWHLWVMAFSTLVLVLTDWCMLSRLMALLPWNRREPLSWELARRTFFTGPVSGSILDRPRAPSPAPA